MPTCSLSLITTQIVQIPVSLPDMDFLAKSGIHLYVFRIISISLVEPITSQIRLSGIPGINYTRLEILFWKQYDGIKLYPVQCSSFEIICNLCLYHIWNIKPGQVTLRLRAVFVVVLGVFFVSCFSGVVLFESNHHKTCLFHIHVPYVMRTTKAYISLRMCKVWETRLSFNVYDSILLIF